MLVVLVVDALPHDVFPRVLLLLQRENVPDEELLQLLVGEVDAQLLKAGRERIFFSRAHEDGEKWRNVTHRKSHKPVFGEILKAKDVEQADGRQELFRFLVLVVNRRVDFVHDPNEKFPVNCLEMTQRAVYLSRLSEGKGSVHPGHVGGKKKRRINSHLQFHDNRMMDCGWKLENPEGYK